jgi:hypothetical protein
MTQGTEIALLQPTDDTARVIDMPTEEFSMRTLLQTDAALRLFHVRLVLRRVLPFQVERVLRQLFGTAPLDGIICVLVKDTILIGRFDDLDAKHEETGQNDERSHDSSDDQSD